MSEEQLERDSQQKGTGGGQAREEAIWFGPAERQLFGWFGRPAGSVARGGVVLCMPVLSESRAAYRMYRTLARRLCEMGYATLRFDYDGTGDSVGCGDNPDRINAWKKSIIAAIAEIRASGISQVSAIGVRLGATLLAEVAADQNLESAVLWDPPLNGRTFLRGQQLLLSAAVGARAERLDDAVQTAGYLLSRATVEEIEQLRFHPEYLEQSIARRLLILARPERPLNKALRAAAEHSKRCEIQQMPGLAELLDVSPEYAVIPEHAIERIVIWLSAEPTDLGTVVRGHSLGQAVLEVGTGRKVRETVERTEHGSLFIMKCEPVDASSAKPWIIMLNVGAESHIGPGRLWVDWSRKWAASGYRCARVDLGGVGESSTAIARPELLVYSPSWLDDLPEIVRTISPDDPNNVVIIGLCSGAYSAVELALSETPPRAIVSINAIIRTETAYEPVLADPRRRAWRPPARVLVNYAHQHPLAAHRIWRCVRELFPQNSIFDPFAKAARSGVNVLVVYGRDDMGQIGRRERYWKYLGLRRVERAGRFRCVILPELDHAMHLSEGQSSLGALLDEHLATIVG